MLAKITFKILAKRKPKSRESLKVKNKVKYFESLF